MPADRRVRDVAPGGCGSGQMWRPPGPSVMTVPASTT
jgi:hypothetical protein